MAKKILVGLVALLFLATPVLTATAVVIDESGLRVVTSTATAQTCTPGEDENCPGPPAPEDEPEETCETSSFTALEWIMCPVFKIGADLADELLEVFQEQLCFRTEASKTTNPDYDCDVTNTEDVKPVWNAMKNIASGLLVVIMLVMIIAQATGRGPFA